MRYYVTADVHGYFDLLKDSLTARGFFEDPEPHKLVICGDLFDRGREALPLQDFLLELLDKEQLLLIQGNHEDLALELLRGWHQGSYLQPHHISNGTVDTVLQLAGADWQQLLSAPEEVGRAFLKSPFVQTLIPAMTDYWETAHYIFTHGWIPCTPIPLQDGQTDYVPIPNWRRADAAAWNRARWFNGMEAAHCGVTVPDKTVVCGHWHCSFGHSQYENDGDEWAPAPNFTPYYGNGIIALDACTARSQTINTILLTDE